MNQLDDRGIPLDWQAPKLGAHLVMREKVEYNGNTYSNYSYILESEEALRLVQTMMGKVHWNCFFPTQRADSFQYPVLMEFDRSDTGMNSHVDNAVFQFGKRVDELLEKVKANHGNHQDHS